MPAHILIAEDDRKQAELLRRYLERDGHVAAVVHDGQAAIDEVRRRRLDLLLLDVMMPRVDGLAVCERVRADMDTPIVVLTARASEDDVLQGLALGADDYITKPFSPRELVARIRTVLRRAARDPARDGGGEGGGGSRGRLRVGPLVVDTVHRQVLVDGRPLATTPAEFDILACLASAPGRPFTRQVLLEHASDTGTGRTIDVHVLNLRRKLEPVPTQPRYLRTVYGVGYRLVDAAEEPDGAPGAAPLAGG
jgi:DNA-binding response OmpR family regulator